MTIHGHVWEPASPLYCVAKGLVVFIVTEQSLTHSAMTLTCTLLYVCPRYT